MARAIVMNSRTSIRRSPPSYFTPPPAKPGMLQEVFNLDEGPVMPTFPADLSATSYEDLKAYFDRFLRSGRLIGGLQKPNNPVILTTRCKKRRGRQLRRERQFHRVAVTLMP